MHIPDGYLSPATCAATYAVTSAFAVYASKKVSKELDEKKIPLIALGSAFSFVIMMFNIPIPGGTTGHAVGGTLIAILLGPWAAMLAVGLALLVQALLFGDGGITTFGANVMAMGVIMPLIGSSTYHLIASGESSKRRKMAGAFIGSYAGIVLAALAVAVLLGIQPIVASDSQGVALYSPFPLNVAVPVMMFEHLLFFGFVEAFATVLVLNYLLSFGMRPDQGPGLPRKLGYLVVSLVLLSPLGIIVPAMANAGGAWGEWGSDELREVAGFIPQGLARLEKAWKAPLPDYILPAGPQEGLLWQVLWYVLCGAIGIVLAGGAVMSLRLLKRRTNA